MTRPADGPSASALVVGYIAAAHGVHGGLRVHLHDPASEALASGRAIVLRRGDQPAGRFVIDAVASVPGKPNRRRITLEGLTYRDEAEALRGCEVLVERDQLPPLADDEFYLADVVGRAVQRQREGGPQHLGEVVGVISHGMQDLFEVRWRDPSGRAHDWLLPVVSPLLVDVGPQRVLVDLPHGMLPEALEVDDDGEDDEDGDDEERGG